MSVRKPWFWQNTINFGREAARLLDARGRVRCTVWSNGTWHTWDQHGVGGENDTAPTVEDAKEQATMAVIRQGWAQLVAAGKKRKQAGR